MLGQAGGPDARLHGPGAVVEVRGPGAGSALPPRRALRRGGRRLPAAAPPGYAGAARRAGVQADPLVGAGRLAVPNRRHLVAVRGGILGRLAAGDALLLGDAALRRGRRSRSSHQKSLDLSRLRRPLGILGGRGGPGLGKDPGARKERPHVHRPTGERERRRCHSQWEWPSKFHLCGPNAGARSGGREVNLAPCLQSMLSGPLTPAGSRHAARHRGQLGRVHAERGRPRRLRPRRRRWRWAGWLRGRCRWPRRLLSGMTRGAGSTTDDGSRCGEAALNHRPHHAFCAASPTHRGAAVPGRTWRAR
mmetsp:Transcript_77924/g.252726  ORF Transcript_77924/g.252726 Transcript_77924/m.252726 type:complete len:305 (+) Transcript_77924:974-1888(+)